MSHSSLCCAEAFIISAFSLSRSSDCPRSSGPTTSDNSQVSSFSPGGERERERGGGEGGREREIKNHGRKEEISPLSPCLLMSQTQNQC